MTSSFFGKNYLEKFQNFEFFFFFSKFDFLGKFHKKSFKQRKKLNKVFFLIFLKNEKSIGRFKMGAILGEGRYLGL